MASVIGRAAELAHDAKFLAMHFNCGWNDTAHGILTWGNGSDKWQSSLEWALHCRAIALDCLPMAKGKHNREYFLGVMACVDEYSETGRIARK